MTLSFPIIPEASRCVMVSQVVLFGEVRFLQRPEIVQGPAVGRLGHQERGGSLRDCDTMGVDRGFWEARQGTVCVLNRAWLKKKSVRSAPLPHRVERQVGDLGHWSNFQGFGF